MLELYAGAGGAMVFAFVIMVATTWALEKRKQQKKYRGRK